MKPHLWLLACAILLVPGTANALQLKWSTGLDTLRFSGSTSATLVISTSVGESSLPRQWQLLWVADSFDVEIQAVDTGYACTGDTAHVRALTPPSSQSELAAHLSSAVFCSRPESPGTLAAWRITLPARARGRLQAFGFNPTQPTAVVSTNIAVFNGSVYDWFTTNVSLLASAPVVSTRASVTLTAVVVPPPLNPALASLKDGNTTIATAYPTGGLASFAVPLPTLGTHTYSVTYDTLVSSPVAVEVINPVPTTTTLSAAPTPSRHYQAVQLTAAVSPSNATGYVHFYDSGVYVSQVALVGGVASMTSADLLVGNHSLRAAYLGDAVFDPSSSALLAHQVTALTPTTLTLRSIPDTVVAGRPFWLKATVTPAPDSGVVDFNAGVPNHVVNMVDGVAMLSVPDGICGGGTDFRAEFNGDSFHYGNYDNLVMKVKPHEVLLTVRSSRPNSRYTEGVTFTAAIADTSRRLCDLDGYVTFFVDSVWAGAYTLTNHDSVVSNPFRQLAPGRHRIHATFEGSLNRQAAPSAPIFQDVEVPKPTFVSIRDVFGDQGGQVKLTWNASYLDLDPFLAIESYWVLRSAPAALVASRLSTGSVRKLPLGGSESLALGAVVATEGPDSTIYWEYVGAQPALHLAKYSFVAPTTTDSTPAANPPTPFMLMARTAGGAEWWFSDPDSGYSVDNLSPPKPLNLVANEQPGGAVVLFWQPIQASDLYGYRLYRGAAPDYVPDSSTLVYSGLDAHFTDQAHGARSYYKLCAADIHGNAGPFAEALAWSAAGAPEGRPLTFGLERVWPNPVRGGKVSCVATLPSPEAAYLDCMDIAGRRVEGVVIGGAAPGRFEVQLGVNRALPPGLYLLRLRQGSRTQVRRLVVLD